MHVPIWSIRTALSRFAPLSQNQPQGQFFCIFIGCYPVSVIWCWMRSMKGTFNQMFCSSLWRNYSTSEMILKSSWWVPLSTQRSFPNILVWHLQLAQFCIRETVDHISFQSFLLDKCPMIHIPGLTFPVEEFLLEDIIEMTRYPSQTRDATNVIRF